jgi:glycosyltransferase involved in cell wall biosynthesis
MLIVRRAEEVLAAASLLAGDPALRAALGDRGRRFAAAELDWERILDRYEGFIGAAGRRSR